MAKLKISNFKGSLPSPDKAKLPDGCASYAINCTFQQGNLKPFKRVAGIRSNTNTSNGDFYFIRGSIDDQNVPHFLDRAKDVCYSPVYNDDERIVFIADYDRADVQAFECDKTLMYRSLNRSGQTMTYLDVGADGRVFGVVPPQGRVTLEHLLKQNGKPVYPVIHNFVPDEDDWKDNPVAPGYVADPDGDEDRIMPTAFYRDQLLTYDSRPFKCKKDTTSAEECVPLIRKEVIKIQDDYFEEWEDHHFDYGDVVKMLLRYFKCIHDDGADNLPLVMNDEVKSAASGEVFEVDEVCLFASRFFKCIAEIETTGIVFEDGKLTLYTLPLMFDDGYILEPYPTGDWDEYLEEQDSISSNIYMCLVQSGGDLEETFCKAKKAKPNNPPYSGSVPNTDEFEFLGWYSTKYRSKINSEYWEEVDEEDMYTLDEDHWKEVDFVEDEYFIVRKDFWKELILDHKLERSVSYVFSHVRRWTDDWTTQSDTYITWSSGLIAGYTEGQHVLAGEQLYRLEGGWPKGLALPDPRTSPSDPRYTEITGSEKNAILYGATINSQTAVPEEESQPGPASNPCDIWNCGEASERVETFVRVKDVPSWQSWMPALYPTLGSTYMRAYKIDAYRWYRSVTGTMGTEWHYVADTTPFGGEWYDYKEDKDLDGDVLQTGNWSVPPFNLTGLTQGQNGILFGFGKKVDSDKFDSRYHIAENEIVMSVPFIHYAMPRDYALSVDSRIVGLGSTGSSVVVCTDDKPYLIEGSDPSTMSIIALPHKQACVSRDSIVSVAGGVVYASPDGLFMIDYNGKGTLITKHIWTKEQWKYPMRDVQTSDLYTQYLPTYWSQAETPDPKHLHGAYYEGCYFGFYYNSPWGFKLDLETGEIVYIDLGIFQNWNPVTQTVDPHSFNGEPYLFNNLYYDSMTDALFLGIWYGHSLSDCEAHIWKWDGNDDYAELFSGIASVDVPDINFYFHWKSKEYQFPSTMSPFSCGRIRFGKDIVYESINGEQTSPVGIQIYGDDESIFVNNNPSDEYTAWVTKNSQWNTGMVTSDYVPLDFLFRLPSGKRYSKWTLMLHGDRPVNEIVLATSVEELMQE